ncbi:MAG: tetratricopeptide repeat protein [Bacteroidota bacterium]
MNRFRIFPQAAVKLLTCMLFLFSSLKGVAQLADARAVVYQAYLDGNAAQWEKGMQIWKNYQRTHSLSERDQYDLALATYGLAGLYMAKEEKSKVSTLLKETEELAEKLLSSRQFENHARALLGGLTGLKIGLSPAKAIFLGPKSMSYLKDAVEEGPNCPAAWVELGNARYHSPALFGGSTDEAIECFQKAIKLYDQQAIEKKANWMYLHSIAWLGQAFERKDQPAKAKATYQKALKVAPGFRWIRDELILNLN